MVNVFNFNKLRIQMSKQNRTQYRVGSHEETFCCILASVLGFFVIAVVNLYFFLVQ